MDAHVTENDAATASTHADVLAPSGRTLTHVPPPAPAAHASSQLWWSVPSRQVTPVLPHAQSPPGWWGGSGGGDRGDGGEGGDGEKPAHGQKRRRSESELEHEKDDEEDGYRHRLLPYK